MSSEAEVILSVIDRVANDLNARGSAEANFAADILVDISRNARQVLRDQVQMLTDPCSASMWLLGSVANCHKSAGHDEDPTDRHEITIQWSTR